MILNDEFSKLTLLFDDDLKMKLNEITIFFKSIDDKSVEFKKIYDSKENNFKCCDCGQFHNIKSSHWQTHKIFKEEARKYIIENFGSKKCVVCGEDIIVKSNLLTDYSRIFCYDSKCSNRYHNYRKIMNNLERFCKRCPCCDKLFFSKKKDNCSKECSYKIRTLKIKEDWKIQKENKSKRWLDLKQRASEKNLFEEYFKNNSVWNKGLTGDEYLKHYIKPDGTNTLDHQTMKRYVWDGRMTSPERKIKEILSELDIGATYNNFYENRQYDFTVTVNEKKFIIEVDGDYWHKSILTCADPSERNIQRKIDIIKDELILEKSNDNEKWFIIRFWESDINQEREKVKNYLKKLFRRENNEYEINKIISEIKEYYKEKC